MYLEQFGISGFLGLSLARDIHLCYIVFIYIGFFRVAFKTHKKLN